MSQKATDALFTAMLAGLKSVLDGGFLYLFAGPMPATPGEALDLVALHTQIAKISAGGDGVTGLTFDAAVGDSIFKSAQAWSGTAAFDGAESAATSLTPSFFRLCPAGDTGRTLVTTPRIQGDIGAIGSGAALEVSSLALAPAAPVSIVTFQGRLRGWGA